MSFGPRNVHPKSPDLYAADGVVYRFSVESRTTPLRVEIDGLSSAQGLAIQSSGEIFVGDHNRGMLLQLKQGDRKPVKTVQDDAFQTSWSIALALDEKSLYASSGAGSGGVSVSGNLTTNPSSVHIVSALPPVSARTRSTTAIAQGA